MSGWNFRVMKHENNGETWLSIHEVYYGEKGKPRAFATDGQGVCENIDTLRQYVDRMTKALDQPILTPDDFSTAFKEEFDEDTLSIQAKA